MIALHNPDSLPRQWKLGLYGSIWTFHLGRWVCDPLTAAMFLSPFDRSINEVLLRNVDFEDAMPSLAVTQPGDWPKRVDCGGDHPLIPEAGE